MGPRRLFRSNYIYIYISTCAYRGPRRRRRRRREGERARERVGADCGARVQGGRAWKGGRRERPKGNTCQEGSCHDDLSRVSREVAAALHHRRKLPLPSPTPPLPKPLYTLGHPCRCFHAKTRISSASLKRAGPRPRRSISTPPPPPSWWRKVEGRREGDPRGPDGVLRTWRGRRHAARQP